MSTARADLKSTISADTTQFAAGMRRAGMIAKNTGNAIGKGMAGAVNSIGKLGAAALKSSAAMVAIGGALAGAAFSKGLNNAAEMGATLDDLSMRTGVAAGELMILGKAFELGGVGADKLGGTLNKMQKVIGDAANGSTSASKALAGIGLSAEALSSMTASQQLDAIGKGVMAITDPAKRAAAAMAIFGRSGGELLPLFASTGVMEEASATLGKQAEIMDRSAGTFALITDKIAAIGDNLRGFYVGFLDGIAQPILGLLDRFDGMDFTEIGQRFAAGLNMENLKAALAATFVFATVAFSEGLVKAFELSYKFFNALFSAEGLAFLGVTLEDVLFAAFDAAGNFLSDILTLGIEKAQALWSGEPLFTDTGKDLAETASEFAARLKDELSDIDAGPSDALKAAAAQYAEMIKSLFPKVEGSGGSGGSGGSTSEADLYDAELKAQRDRVAADAAAMAAAAPIEQMGPSAALKMANAGEQVKRNSAIAGGFTGLAGLAQMQLDKGSGLGPGETNAFAKDRERLGLKSGLSGGLLPTGGLGEKRKVGQQKADGENKKNLTLAEKQAASLENIEQKISASLTVN